MANPARPAVCSTADYQLFHPLAGFPPALGWCSTVSLLPRRSEHDDANALAPRDIQCPTGSTLCALLADLKATDREFARGAWYDTLLNLETFPGKEKPLTKFQAVALEYASVMNLL